jgi:hypothetical protein
MPDKDINKSEKNDKNKEETTISVDVDEETSYGIYSNLAMSNFSKEEFYLDFAFLQPHTRKGKVRSRIIVSPKNAKRLALLLTKNIKDYEKKFGSIDEPTPSQGINLSFN